MRLIRELLGGEVTALTATVAIDSVAGVADSGFSLGCTCSLDSVSSIGLGSNLGCTCSFDSVAAAGLGCNLGCAGSFDSIAGITTAESFRAGLHSSVTVAAVSALPNTGSHAAVSVGHRPPAASLIA